jgi:phosphoglycerate dehydrogenase-like enzyme
VVAVKVVFLQELNPITVERFRRMLAGHELVFPQSSDPEVQAKAAQGADVLVGYRLPKVVADAAPRLKAFLTGAAGVDRTVAVSLTGRGDVQVGNSHANALDVAEHALALAMDAAKLISRGDREMRRGDWTLRYDDVPGTLLTGKTALLVGYGAIGRALAGLLAGFRMRLLGVRRTATPGSRDDLGVEAVALLEGLAVADFVFVLAPLTAATKGMLGRAEVDRMKQGAVLVNVSRGPVVEEDALFEALESGRIAAGLDVWYVYPKGGGGPETRSTFPGRRPFHELPNVVLSPHRASYTERMHTEQWDDVVENVQRIARGERVKFAVDLEQGY